MEDSLADMKKIYNFLKMEKELKILNLKKRIELGNWK